MYAVKKNYKSKSQIAWQKENCVTQVSRHCTGKIFPESLTGADGCYQRRVKCCCCYSRSWTLNLSTERAEVHTSFECWISHLLIVPDPKTSLKFVLVFVPRVCVSFAWNRRKGTSCVPPISKFKWAVVHMFEAMGKEKNEKKKRYLNY